MPAIVIPFFRVIFAYFSLRIASIILYTKLSILAMYKEIMLYLEHLLSLLRYSFQTRAPKVSFLLFIMISLSHVNYLYYKVELHFCFFKSDVV